MPTIAGPHMVFVVDIFAGAKTKSQRGIGAEADDRFAVPRHEGVSLSPNAEQPSSSEVASGKISPHL